MMMTLVLHCIEFGVDGGRGGCSDSMPGDLNLCIEEILGSVDNFYKQAE